MINGFDRALIIKKEYLDKILSGDKTWEMRSRKTKITGLVGLIESGSGLIVGQCFIHGSLEPIDQNTALNTIDKHCVEDVSLLEKWNHPWVISEAVSYESPIPYNHPQGAVIWVSV